MQARPIAVVLANTYEVARDAAHRVVVDYEETSRRATFESPGAVEQELATPEQEARRPQSRRFRGGFRQPRR